MSGPMDEMKLKVFTVEEANKLIPRLTGQIKELKDLHREVLAKEVEIDTLELLYPGPEEGKPSAEVGREVQAYNEMLTTFYRLIDEIHGRGCFLKDIGTGLVDFYSLHEGRVVYLCWKLGEEEVGHWHEVGRGYAYRQPISSQDKESSG